MESARSIKQREFAKIWIEKGMYGILHIAPRVGKTRVTINVFEELKPRKVLIAYPDNKIKKSWEDEFKLLGITPPDITYTTHLSIKKYINKEFDMVVIDEIHLLSPSQVEKCAELFQRNPTVLGLSGTLSKQTQRYLEQSLSLQVIANYPIHKAIEEGILPDYEITVFQVPLDTKTLKFFGKKVKTEKKAFDNYTWVIENLENEGKSTMFVRLARMRVIQTSNSKIIATKQLINAHSQERILVFCGTIIAAESLGIPSFHSKSKDKEIFEAFAKGEGNHLAVVKIGNTGVTYKPLNRVIINYFDSNPENMAQKINRCMSMEYDNPDKKALIYIISTDEDVELKWLKKALEFFSPEKIKYI